MTNQRPKTDGVVVCDTAYLPVGIAPIGITDLTERVDATMTPAVIKATLFSEALCRLEQMKGEREQLDRNIKAQVDRMRELSREMDEVVEAEIKRVTGGDNE